MKKLFLLLSLVIFLCLPVASYAASIGGAETVGKEKFGISVNQDFIFGRDGEYDEGGPSLSPGVTLEINSEIDRINRTLVKSSYGLTDGLDIYALLGTSDFKSTQNVTASGFAGPVTSLSAQNKLKGDYGFVYGVGMKIKKELESNWIIGGDLQYLEQRNDFSVTQHDSRGFSENGDGDVTFQEWHIAPYVAKKIGDFVPYLGVKYSSVKTKYKTEWDDGDTDTTKFDSKDNVGVFLGTDYKVGENWSLNLEGRFIDEEAVSFSVAYKF